MAIHTEQVLAFEVLRKRKKHPDLTERLGHVVQMENQGELAWVAYAIVAEQDSFLGSFASAKLAREAIVENEKRMTKGARDD